MGGQGRCERRSEVFVIIPKKNNFFFGGVGWGSDQRLGWGGGSKVWGRSVMWGMGGVNQELKALINVNKGFVQY